MAKSVALTCHNCGAGVFRLNLEDTGNRVATVWCGRPPGTTDRWCALDGVCAQCGATVHLGGIGTPDNSGYAAMLDAPKGAKP